MLKLLTLNRLRSLKVFQTIQLSETLVKSKISPMLFLSRLLIKHAWKWCTKDTSKAWSQLTSPHQIYCNILSMTKGLVCFIHELLSYVNHVHECMIIERVKNSQQEIIDFANISLSRTVWKTFKDLSPFKVSNFNINHFEFAQRPNSFS